MGRPAFTPPTQAPGFAARRAAAEIVEGVLYRGRSLDEQLEGPGACQGLGFLSDRDRALVRRIVAASASFGAPARSIASRSSET